MLVKRSETFQAIQKRFRSKRFLRIERIIRMLASETRRVRILDLGGTAEYWKMLASDLRSQVELTLVNLRSELDLYDAEIDGIEIRHHEGDACDLPEFDDGSFDLVHSNSVIEHVRSYNSMLRFASEVRRLGRFYYVQTPNFWFPIDPHYGRPFVHWLPEPARIALYQRIRISQAPKADFQTAMARCDDIKIIDAEMMRRLFPDGRQERERFLLLTKSVMMIREASPEADG